MRIIGLGMSILKLKQIHKVLILLLISIPLFNGFAEISVKAFVDRTVIGLNQQFTINVELSGEGINSASNPQLPDMQQFATYLGSGSSQNMQFINGRMSVSKTISYHFQATAVGKFKVGSIQVVADGKNYKTDPIQVEITQSSTPPQTSRSRTTPDQSTDIATSDLFIRAEVDKRRVFKNQPVTVTYKIYTRVNVSQFGYAKQPSTTGFWVEEYPQDGQPQTQNEVFEGRQYTTAVIKKMAIFPMTPGAKTLEPMEIDCEVRVRRRSRDLFNDFFSDPFGRSIRKRIASNPVNIEVLPLPTEGQPSNFTGVVGSFTINGNVDKKKVKTNEAVTYKINIQGQGNIRTFPELNPNFSTDFEVYPPKTAESVQHRENGVFGTKTYEYVLVPRVQGILSIKPIQLSIFNPKTRRYSNLETDEIKIDVEKGDDTFISTPIGLSKEEVRLVGQDIRFIKTQSPQFKSMFNADRLPSILWIILVTPLFFVAIALVYRRHLDRISFDMAYARERKASRIARKHFSVAKSLLKADTQKEFFAEMGKALAGFLGDKLNIAEAGMLTDNVQGQLKERKVDPEVIEEYVSCLKTCDMQRFSPTVSSVDEMNQFYNKAEKALLKLQKAIQ